MYYTSTSMLSLRPTYHNVILSFNRWQYCWQKCWLESCWHIPLKCFLIWLGKVDSNHVTRFMCMKASLIGIQPFWQIPDKFSQLRLLPGHCQDSSIHLSSAICTIDAWMKCRRVLFHLGAGRRVHWPFEPEDESRLHSLKLLHRSFDTFLNTPQMHQTQV